MTTIARISFVAFLLLPSCSSPNRTFADASDGRMCTSNADCDDHTPCTTDLCLIGGMCSNQPNNSMCMSGQTCVSGMGCVTQGMTCTSNAQCNDNVACTMDACLVDRTCSHTPNNNLCPPGQTCGASGCVSSCTSDADCNDNIMCTLDTCGSSGMCVHTARNNLCTPPQVCNPGMGCVMASACESDAQCDDHMYCNGMETCSSELACVAGMPVNCDDMNPCTIDACDNSMMACTHMMDPACMMVHSGIYDISPAISYSCAFAMYHLNITMLMFAISGGTLTVTGTPAPMSSPAPTGTSFDVMGVNPGDCEEHYELRGMFSDPMHFTGTLTVNFVDTSGLGGCIDCTMHSFMVTGTAAP